MYLGHTRHVFLAHLVHGADHVAHLVLAARKMQVRNGVHEAEARRLLLSEGALGKALGALKLLGLEVGR